MYISNGLFIYLLIVHPPLATLIMNRLEIFNEIMVLTCTLMLFGLTDYTPQGQDRTPEYVRDILGWMYISLSCAIIGVTASAIAWETLNALK